MSEVEYRPVVDFPDYVVGDDGSVWSLKTRCGYGKWCVGTVKRRMAVYKDKATAKEPRILPYHRVYLSNDKVRSKMKGVHIAVLEAFVGLCPPGMECRHKGGNVENNRLDNLEWGTKSQNCSDKRKHGTAPIGTRNKLAKLTDDKVKEMRRLYSEGVRVSKIFRQFGVSQSVAWNAILRRTWKHV